MRDGFIFQKSFAEALIGQRNDVKHEVMKLVVDYAIWGIEHKAFHPAAQGIFSLIKPQIEYVKEDKGDE